MTEPVCKLNYKIVDRRPLTIRRVPGVNTGWQAGPTSPGATMQPNLEFDQVDIEWTHTDGFPPDTEDRPVRMKDARLIIQEVLKQADKDDLISGITAADIINKVFPKVVRQVGDQQEDGVITIEVGVRKVINDCVYVPKGSSTASVQMILEEKRHSLAQALKIDP